jgi:uncharacterized membrane protein
MKEKENRLWFVQKKYGWGWTPATWQGWTALAIYVFVIWMARRLTELQFMCLTFLVTAIFLVLCFKKGERPKWRWG